MKRISLTVHTKLLKVRKKLSTIFIWSFQTFQKKLAKEEVRWNIHFYVVSWNWISNQQFGIEFHEKILPIHIRWHRFRPRQCILCTFDVIETSRGTFQTRFSDVLLTIGLQHVDLLKMITLSFWRFLFRLW